MNTFEDAYSLLGIHQGLTAIIGGGGKTSLLLHLASVYRKKGSVLVATTTHIYPPEQYPLQREIHQVLNPGECFAIGEMGPNGKLSPPSQTFTSLRQFSDYIFIEADGSRGLPLKAHASHEPVIPEEADTVLAVVGMDGIGKPIREAAHRPALYAEALGVSEEDIVTENMCVAMIKRYPRVTGVVLNKTEVPEQKAHAERIAAMLSCPVVLTSFKPDSSVIQIWRNGKCLYS